MDPLTGGSLKVAVSQLWGKVNKTLSPLRMEGNLQILDVPFQFWLTSKHVGKFD